MISIVLSALLLAGPSQAKNGGPPTAMVRSICGTLVYSHQLPRRKEKKSGTVRYKTKSMDHVPVFLYKREENPSCCEGLSPVARLETGRSGRFEFERIGAGLYWIAVPNDDHEAVLALSYEPIKDSSLLCPSYTFVLYDNGRLSLEVTVTVD